MTINERFNFKCNKSADCSHVEVEVTTRSTNDVRLYTDIDTFINDLRFFHSGGKPSDLEYKILDYVQFLAHAGSHGLAVEFSDSGLLIKLVYYRWNDFDRFMNKIM